MARDQKQEQERASKQGKRVFALPSGGAITLYQRDCIRGMHFLIEPRSVDVVVTSPPYNLGIAYAGDYDDSMERDEYKHWMGIWAVRVHQILKDDGSLFLNVGSKPTDPWVPFDLLEVMRGRFKLQNVIHWVKSIAINQSEVGSYDGIVNDVVVGHYKPINSPRFLNDCHEYIFHLTKTGAVPIDRLALGVQYQDKTNIARWAGAGGGKHCRGNTWFIPYETITSRERDRPHPASFPLELPRRCIRLHGLERTKLVVDPFMGIGTTALACKELGVACVGFELSEEYCDQACRSLVASSETVTLKEND